MKSLSLCALLLIFSTCIFSQQKDTLVNKLDSLNKKTDTTGGQTNIINPKAYTETTRISFPAYFVLLGNDIKQDFTAPFHQTSKEWAHIGIYGASVAAFSVLADEPIQRSATKIHDNNKTVASVSSYVTKFGGKYELYSLAALGGYGFIFNNKKMQTTTLLATQAYLTSGLIESIAKYITGRQRPSYNDPNQPEAEPTFRGPGYSLGHNIYNHKISTSFPSGHTTVIFAAATVFAKEYKNTPWVPVVAYSAASLVGLSRITENKHWATDVIVGATLGYLCGGQVVNNYHRYAKLKAPSKSGTLSFNLNYNGYNFEPGLVYTFRR
ncbi:MAG TPA: phosphatase PAP2 family protein [Parafilimonas sp.]|nr:phosphatase PAP2 family protein [Parafilimonas sp.]